MMKKDPLVGVVNLVDAPLFAIRPGPHLLLFSQMSFFYNCVSAITCNFAARKGN